MFSHTLKAKVRQDVLIRSYVHIQLFQTQAGDSFSTDSRALELSLFLSVALLRYKHGVLVGDQRNADAGNPAVHVAAPAEIPPTTKAGDNCAVTQIQDSKDSTKSPSTRPDTTLSPPATKMTTSSADPAGDLALEILQLLSKQDPILTSEAYPSLSFDQLKPAIDRLAGRDMITFEKFDNEELILEPEAQQIVDHGSHEARVFEAVSKAMEGLSIQELEQAIGDKTVTKMGQGKAFKEKWISKGKDGKLVATVRAIGL